jgi:hypothetical protein
MAKPIIVSLEGKESRFDFKKLSRDKLYGKRRREVVDLENKPCRRASLTEDGSLLLLSGMTGQGYLDATGRLVERSEMVGLDAGGAVVERKPSTLGDCQELHGPVAASEVLDLSVQSVYMLDIQQLDQELADALAQGEVYRFGFNYYSDFNVETAYLVANKAGLFALVGNPVETEWCELDVVPPETFEEAVLDDADDLDFEMF